MFHIASIFVVLVPFSSVKAEWIMIVAPVLHSPFFLADDSHVQYSYHSWNI